MDMIVSGLLCGLAGVVLTRIYDFIQTVRNQPQTTEDREPWITWWAD